MAAWCYLFSHVNGWTTHYLGDLPEIERLARKAAHFGHGDAAALAYAGIASPSQKNQDRVIGSKPSRTPLSECDLAPTFDRQGSYRAPGPDAWTFNRFAPGSDFLAIGASPAKAPPRKDRIEYLVRMANAREQVFAGRPASSAKQFFALRSPAPVHRITILIACCVSPSSPRSAAAIALSLAPLAAEPGRVRQCRLGDVVGDLLPFKESIQMPKLSTPRRGVVDHQS